MMLDSPATASEATLIRSAQSGDRDAFDRLLEPYRTRLASYLRRYCDGVVGPEDLVQETALRAWRALERYDHRDRFASWLFGIAHNTGLDARRRARVRSADDLPRRLSARQPDDPEAVLLGDELAGVLAGVVRELPPKQERVFRLRHCTDLKFREIAELTGEPLSTVLGHMHYAVRKLRTALEEYRCAKP